MAWVSVHEEITGKKLRSLSKEIGCSQNECIGLLIRLWLWGLKNADRTGKIIDADRQDVADVLTVGLERDIRTIDVVDAMIDCEWIDEDEDGLYLHDWEDWQESWYTKEEQRKRNAERQRLHRKKARADKSEAAEEPEQEAEQKAPASRYGSGFEEFWNAYPRKVGKGEAYAKYKARLGDGWSEEQLITAARKYAYECEKDHTEMKYIKHGKTFLSDKMPFTDYLPRGLNAKGDSMSPTYVSGTSAATDDDPYADWRQ